MSRPAFPRIALLTLSLALAPLACGGDEVLSPPDGAACTAGTIAAGVTREGAVSPESCRLYSAYLNWETYGESWTLKAKANTAYVVRLRPLDPDDDEFLGELVAYARSSQGDAMFATAAPFLLGLRGREMFLVADRDRTISLRVEVPDYYDTFGEYELEVESCPVTAFRAAEDEEEIEGLDMTAGCTSLGFDDRHESLVRFVSFPARLDASYEVGAERTEGNAPLRIRLLGPDLDLGEMTSGSVWYDAPVDVAGYGFEPEFTRAGRYVLALGIHHDSTATVRAAFLRGSLAALRNARPEESTR